MRHPSRTSNGKGKRHFGRLYSDPLVCVNTIFCLLVSMIVVFLFCRFPTVFYVKAGTDKPMIFDGDRSMDGLMKFIEKNGPKEGEEAKEEIKLVNRKRGE